MDWALIGSCEAVHSAAIAIADPTRHQCFRQSSPNESGQRFFGIDAKSYLPIAMAKSTKWVIDSDVKRGCLNRSQRPTVAILALPGNEMISKFIHDARRW